MTRNLREQITTALKVLADTAVDLAEWVPARDVDNENNGDESSGSSNDDDMKANNKRGPRRKEKLLGQELLREAEKATRVMVDRGNEIEAGVGVLRGNGVVGRLARHGREEQGEEGDEEKKQGLWDVYEEEMATWKEQYGARTMRDRYGDQVEYVQFRKLIWDAQHGDGEEMPPVRSWFPEDNNDNKKGKHNIPKETLSSQTQTQTSTFPPTRQPNATDNDLDSESDLEIQTTKQSLTCPLTLLRFVTPMTSKVCPHSFEKAAILEMINKTYEYRLSTITDGSSEMQHMYYVPDNPHRRNQQNHRVPQGYVKVTKCPVAGCRKMLGVDDIQEDVVLLRRIKRDRERREREEMALGLDDDDGAAEESKNGNGGEGGGKGKYTDMFEESFIDADGDTNMAGARAATSNGRSSSSRRLKQERGKEKDKSARPMILNVFEGDDDD